MQFETFENVFMFLNLGLLLVTMVFSFLQSASVISESWSWVPQKTLLVSNGFQILFLGLRCFSSGHFPLSNLYESLLFLGCVLTTLLIFLNSRLHSFSTKIPSSFVDEKVSQSKRLGNFSSFLSSLFLPFIVLINTFATFSLPSQLKVTTALVPALKSNWLMMHVTFMVLSYGALLGGCIFSIAFLTLSFFAKNQFSNVLFPSLKVLKTFNSTDPVNSPAQLSNGSGSSFQTGNLATQTDFQNSSTLLPASKPQRLSTNQSSFKLVTDFQGETEALTKTLDNLSYRLIGFGFPLLTIGILSGAVWANQTWGSYWSWDPKETWALITWLVFAIYLHTRISHQWTGRQSAWVAAFGFLIIWVCYLGVNLLGKGLHSYGFFQ